MCVRVRPHVCVCVCVCVRVCLCALCAQYSATMPMAADRQTDGWTDHECLCGLLLCLHLHCEVYHPLLGDGLDFGYLRTQHLLDLLGVGVSGFQGRSRFEQLRPRSLCCCP